MTAVEFQKWANYWCQLQLFLSFVAPRLSFTSMIVAGVSVVYTQRLQASIYPKIFWFKSSHNITSWTRQLKEPGISRNSKTLPSLYASSSLRRSVRRGSGSLRNSGAREREGRARKGEESVCHDAIVWPIFPLTPTRKKRDWLELDMCQSPT